MLKEQFLRFFFKLRGNSEKTILVKLEKDFFWFENFYFSKEQDWKMQQRKKDETKKGEEKLKAFHRKRWKEEVTKETEKKHKVLQQ